jgi:hypothetical protein
MSFLCCGSGTSTPSRSKRAEAEAETRRARIIPILEPPSPVYAPEYRRRRSSSGHDLPPPRYEDIGGSVSLSGAVGALGEEKEASGPSSTETAEPRPRETMSYTPSIQIQHETESDHSSVISIPSTQVTGLGSIHTGTTTLRGDRTGRNSPSLRQDSARNSEDRSSGRRTLVDGDDEAGRPPSYYATVPGNRSRSSSPGSNGGSELDSVWRHPVMREGWFENLRGTRRDGEWRQ